MTSTMQLKAPTGYQIVDPTYTVPSSTKANVNYTIRHEPGRWVCNCTAGHYGKGCKHIAAVKAGEVKIHVRLVAQQPKASELLYS